MALRFNSHIPPAKWVTTYNVHYAGWCAHCFVFTAFTCDCDMLNFYTYLIKSIASQQLSWKFIQNLRSSSDKFVCSTGFVDSWINIWDFWHLLSLVTIYMIHLPSISFAAACMFTQNVDITCFVTMQCTSLPSFLDKFVCLCSILSIMFGLKHNTLRVGMHGSTTNFCPWQIYLEQINILRVS